MAVKSDMMPGFIFKFSKQALHFVGIPVFVFLFIIFYKPFSVVDTLELRNGTFVFNVSIISSILFVTLLLTRLLMWGLRNTVSFTRRIYLLWCAGEVVVSSLLIALYLCLISDRAYSYIDLVPVVLGQLAAIVVFPYLIFILFLESDILNRYSFSDDSQEKRMKFYDERRTLKFVTEPSSILYIESNDNYCAIYYTEAGRIKSFMLRSTMKGIETLCSKHGIVRCHRSYFVNIKRINVLRKDRDGSNYAELDIPGLQNIPISPRYYEDVSQMM